MVTLVDDYQQRVITTLYAIENVAKMTSLQCIFGRNAIVCIFSQQNCSDARKTGTNETMLLKSIADRSRLAIVLYNAKYSSCDLIKSIRPAWINWSFFVKNWPSS